MNSEVEKPAPLQASSFLRKERKRRYKRKEREQHRDEIKSLKEEGRGERKKEKYFC